MEQHPRRRGAAAIAAIAAVASIAFGAIVIGSATPAGAALPASVTLLADFGTGDSGDAQSLAALNGKVYFAGSTPTSKGALYVSDGKGANSLVADLRPNGDAGTYDLISNGSKVFFNANDGTNGAEWWASDGTAAGTAMLKDVQPGAGGAAPYGSFVLGSTAYTFMFPSTASGWQLWKSNGTSAGTSLVVETATWDVLPVGSAGGKAYFTAMGFDSHYELWVTDGTSVGTHMVKDLFSTYNNYTNLFDFTPFGSSMVFAVGQGTQKGLWITDGTEAGTVRLYATPAGTTIGGVTTVGGSIYASFYISEACGASNSELVKSDGTVGGTAPVISNACSVYEPGFKDIGVLGSGLVLSRYSPSDGWELWKSDGTSGGTTLVKNLDGTTGSSDPFDFVQISATRTAFYANITRAAELWSTDGTADGTQRLTLYGARSTFNAYDLGRRLVLDGTLFFVADDFIRGRELWTSDGTTAGTRLEYDALTTGDSGFGDPVLFGDGLLTSALVTGYGYELVYSDGTPDGTRMVKDINPGINESTPSQITPIGESAVFRAYYNTKYQLWTTDGTDAGTHLVKDPGGTGGPILNYGRIIQFGSGALFAASEPDTGVELWITDGTDAGTTLVKDINPGSDASGVNNFVSMGGKVYFTANDGTSGGELWVTDGTTAGTTMVKDIWPGSDGGLAIYTAFVAAGSTLYFFADDGTNGKELWKSDGTTAGTTMVKDINPGSDGGLSVFTTPVMANANGTIFFPADDGTNGTELWKSDGTTAGTTMVKDINPGSDSGLNLYAGQMLAIGAVVYVAADDGTNGTELWKSDGTTAGTTMVKNIWTGDNSSAPGKFAAFEGSLVFSACSEIAFCEVWMSDGTSAGTTSPFDLTPKSNVSGLPAWFVQLGKQLVFAEKSADYGTEMYTYDPRDPQTISFTPPSGTKAHEKVALSASATSGLPVTFTTSGDCEIVPSGRDAGKLHFKRQGTCTVTASQSGDETWAAALSVQAVLTVVNNTVTVKFLGVVPAIAPAGLRTNAFGFGNVQLQAEVTPALEGCQVQFDVSPDSGSPSGPYFGTSDENGIVLSSPLYLGQGVYDFTVTPLGDCEGTPITAPQVVLGPTLPETGSSSAMLAWLASMLVLAGALIVWGSTFTGRRGHTSSAN